jgi:hypothetical protein
VKTRLGLLRRARKRVRTAVSDLPRQIELLDSQMFVESCTQMIMYRVDKVTINAGGNDARLSDVDICSLLSWSKTTWTKVNSNKGKP